MRPSVSEKFENKLIFIKNSKRKEKAKKEVKNYANLKQTDKIFASHSY